MWRFAISRLHLVVPTFFGMTLLAFFLIRLVPGDPIETLAGERGIDAARHAVLLHEYGLGGTGFVRNCFRHRARLPELSTTKPWPPYYLCNAWRPANWGVKPQALAVLTMGSALPLNWSRRTL